MNRERTLIIDVGAHTGEDTDFYLGKGFRVVAVEANPALARRLRERFAAEQVAGRLTVVDRAVSETAGTISFYVNDAKDDWSATDYDVASKGTYDVTEVNVETVTLAELFDTYGVPHYLKVDIEGDDPAVARSLLASTGRPEYVSFEWHEAPLLALLEAAGYGSYQVVNQWLKGITQTAVVPPREGDHYWPGAPTGTSSGLFGAELPEDEWVGFADIMAQWLAYRPLLRTASLRHSWLDLHARRAG